MAVSYIKLFHMMLDRKITNVQLKDMAGVSANIITRLKRDEYVSIESIERTRWKMEFSVHVKSRLLRLAGI